MKEEIIQIFVDNSWVYGLCKSGRIYCFDQSDDVAEWELVTEPPRISYTLPKKK
jgi:outer membrane protein assembly factor BamB